MDINLFLWFFVTSQLWTHYPVLSECSSCRVRICQSYTSFLHSYFECAARCGLYCDYASCSFWRFSASVSVVFRKNFVAVIWHCHSAVLYKYQAATVITWYPSKRCCMFYLVIAQHFARIGTENDEESHNVHLRWVIIFVYIWYGKDCHFDGAKCKLCSSNILQTKTL